ncbi:MAG: nucleotidyltransferase domain-containing protein [Proteobacteria bacterium]|nr:nucleotidyltransferase domain-containing protein [Pseudomonadota bacterium]
MGKEDILGFIRQNKHYLKEHFHIKRIGLFGSFVHNEQTEDSDIDIAREKYLKSYVKAQINNEAVYVE